MKHIKLTLKEKWYKKGYDQGYFDARLDAMNKIVRAERIK